MRAIKLSSKNQMVLPKKAREALHVKGGDDLLVVVKGETVIIMPKPKDHVSALYGKGDYPKDYLKKEHRTWTPIS